jgi:two-component sensor histidine kinase
MKIYFNYFVCCCVILFSPPAFSQSEKQPVAKFSFNNENTEDEISKQKAKLVGAIFTDDRFGNSKSAVFLMGQEYSYINLGTYSALKPRTGSISIWINMARYIYYGRGYDHNPIILTKNAPRDDYHEAYAIFLDFKAKRLMASSVYDSLSSHNIYDTKEFTFTTWHHLVMTYDNENFSFYVDGKRVGTTLKDFEIKFDPLDSVIVGGSANKKNIRYTNGTFDDIEFFDTVLTQSDVDALYHAPNPNRTKIVLNWILVILLIAGGVTGLYFFIRYRFRVTLKKEKERLELANKLLENDLRIHRALMNPHFIFNALNSLHNHILTNNTDVASDYLVKFSRLIRKILDSNMTDTISLETEIDLLNRYLEIEELRFNNSIKHEVIIEDIIPSTVTIPIMMVQPFVENSVWHGLRDKQGEKVITISFSLYETNYIKCVVEDNGTGRKIKPNPEKASLSTGFVKQRLDLLNKIHNLSCSLTITDKPNGTGTIVTLLMPILKK